ncbi:MAG: hypothetical protein AAFQ65_14980, partial [Myxococcota bacterium]
SPTARPVAQTRQFAIVCSWIRRTVSPDGRVKTQNVEVTRFGEVSTWDRPIGIRDDAFGIAVIAFGLGLRV